MTDLTLGVVVTNYNTRDLTGRCLEKILAYREGIDRILVVDDASPEGPPVPPDPAVEVRVNPANLGLVRSLNLAIRALGTDVAVLFDSDAYPLNEFPQRVRQLFGDDPDLGIAGFATVDEDGRPTGSTEAEPDAASLVLGQRLHALWTRLLPGSGDGLGSVYTCAMAVRTRAFEELGGFDEAFDWLDLDHDLCMRANRSRWRVAHAPEIVAFHRGSGTPQAVRHRVQRFYKNRWLLLRKFGKIRHPRLVRSLVLARLGAEYAALRLLGRAVARDPEALRDKLEGRRAVIRYCLRNYR
ncbi:MAG TPA: glycosyltransferase [Thermoanaerobaculia bacterium]|nr:glycosyltransferase [Thermoanaerobaculia bacterium]